MGADLDRRRFLQTVPGGLALVAGLSAAGAGAGASLIGSTPASATPPAIGTLSVPKLKLTRTIYQGIENTSLDIGVGYGMWSALPGQSGHCMIFGHRTVHGGPFRGLNKLKIGDKVAAGGVTYTVRKIQVIPSADRVKIWTYDGSGARISLVACSTASGAPTSLKYRICVRASV